MNFAELRNSGLAKQYFLCIASTLFFVAGFYFFKNFFDYKVVAMVLLLVVSVQATLFKIYPVLISAILSAGLLNYLFIPPYFTFHIDNSEDILLFFIYLSVVIVNAVLTHQIKIQERKARIKEQKERTLKLYNTLLNSLSHELRTPISTIIGNVDALKENQNLDSEIQKNLLNEIDIASLRLNRQVENLLNMSRLESGTFQLKLDWADANELIFSVINKFSSFKTHKIIFHENENLPLMKFDDVLIGQSLFNIIHNAIIYTPEFTEINIKIQEKNNRCNIEISDDGTGIPEEKIPFLFDKFYRLPNSKTGGSGLGLSIAKGYLEAHRGKISAKNNEKGGATFILDFPVETSYINNLKNE